MSIIGDHLRDDSCRGMYGPGSTEKVEEIMRLAGLLATARVRRYVYNQGLAQVETKVGVEKRVKNATESLRNYVTDALK